MKAINRKAWWNYEKAKYKKKIQQKEESLQLHIKEMDNLRNENKRLVLKLNEDTKKGANLIDFAYWILENTKSNDIIPWKVDEYLASINSEHRKETSTIKENKELKKDCPDCGFYRGFRTYKRCATCGEKL